MEQMLTLWTYLQSSPLLHLTLTLVVFSVGVKIYQTLKLNPLANPVLFSIVVIVLFLQFTDVSYETYFEGAQFVHFLLGPATVALAIPLYRQLDYVKKSAKAIVVGLLCGSVTSTSVAVACAYFLGASVESVISIGPKSVTTPVAMGITEQLGGLPSLTAVLVILTGIVGAIVGPIIFDLLKIKDWSARGIAMGTACHGIGTASIMLDSEKGGAFSGLAMGLNAVVTAIVLPLIWPMIF